MVAMRWKECGEMIVMMNGGVFYICENFKWKMNGVYSLKF